MNALLDREPVLTLDLIKSGLMLAVAFGLDLTAEQIALVMTFATAALSYLTRARVTPVS